MNRLHSAPLRTTQWIRIATAIAVMAGLAPLLLHPEIPQLMRGLTGLAPLGVRNIGYSAHLGAYFFATLSVLAIYAARTPVTVGAIVAILTVHGAATEISQMWIPARDCDPWDLLCNLSGAAAAAVVWTTGKRFVEPTADVVPTRPAES